MTALAIASPGTKSGTKYCVPGLPQPLVDRPKLVERLNRSQRRRVTLVSAPPGAGKTTLVASWFQQQDADVVAWITLDRRDNDPARLAAVVVTALASVGLLSPELDVPVGADLMLLDAAFDHLIWGGTPAVLVFDDVQELNDPGALDLLTYILERAPACLDSILLTRADPTVRLGRLRLEGQLGEVRNNDLVFSRAEASELFAAHGVRLSQADVRTMWGRTEGWAAGLRLAARALQQEPEPRRFIDDAAGTEAVVADYLLTEVLSRLDERAQRLLLRTSVVDRLTPELAVFLSDDSDVNTHLAELIRSGVFAVELQSHTAYHYHSLFATLLRARLRQRDPRLTLDLHRRAAEWYAANDMPLEAEEHARLAHEWLMLGNLVGRRWLSAMLEGRPLRPDPLSEVPAAVIRRTPGLALVAGAAACARHDREGAELYRAAAGPMSAGSRAAQDPVAGVLRAALDVSFACAFGAEPSTEEALDVLRSLPAEGWAGPELHRFAILRGAELDLDAGAFERAGRALEELSDSGEPSWTTLEASGFLALVRAGDSRLDLAERLAGTVLNADHLARPVAAHAAGLAAVLCAAQRGEERRAADGLAQTDPAGALPSRCLRAVDRALRSGLHGGSLLTVGLDSATAGHPLAERALVSLGVLEVINGDGRLVGVGGPAEAAVRLGRQRMASGAYEALSHTVDEWSGGGAARSAHPRTLIEAASLAVVGASARGDHKAVVVHLRGALEIVAATGIRAPILHLDLLVPALRLHASDMGRQQGLALELLDRITHSNNGVTVEPLTEREVTVLRYLPTLMSNAEMAGAMHLSVNTVKTHLKALYRKLGVDGRRHAVMKGRELELL